MRELLLRQATHLFATRGFDATSVQDVVNVADATKGAFYYHFESKDDLLYEIHQRFISYELEHGERILAQGDPPRETLRALIISLVESIALFKPEVTIFFREMHRLSPGKFATIKEARDRYESFFMRVIEQGQEAGIFRTDIPAHLQTLAIFGMCNWTYIWYRAEGSETPRQIGKDFAQLILSGIEVAPESGKITPRIAPAGTAKADSIATESSVSAERTLS